MNRRSPTDIAAELREAVAQLENDTERAEATASKWEALPEVAQRTLAEAIDAATTADNLSMAEREKEIRLCFGIACVAVIELARERAKRAA